MHIQNFATLIILGIGLFALIGGNLFKKAAKKPVLIEIREITYKRRSRNKIS